MGLIIFISIVVAIIDIVFIVPIFTSVINTIRYHDNFVKTIKVMLLQGVPDKYAMERLGQATNNMLKNVYQHTFKDQQTKISDKLNKKFNEIIK